MSPERGWESCIKEACCARVFSSVLGLVLEVPSYKVQS